MRAAVLKEDGRFVVEETPRPVPEGRQLLIRVSYCGICGSDLHSLRAGALTPGSILGHEISGTVEAVGPEVLNVEPGERVTTLSAIPCDRCDPCRAGRFRSCDGGWQIYGYGSVPGGYAEFVLGHSAAVRKMPQNLTEVAAALNEPAMVGLHAVRESVLEPGQTALVIGAGPIGLLVLQAAKLAAAGAVVVVEPSAGRRKMASRLGADAVLDPGSDDVPAFLSKRTEAGPPVVFECAGAPGTLQRAVELVRPGGQVILAGVNYEPDAVAPLVLVGKECEVKAILGGGDLFGHTLDLIAAGKLQTEPLVTRVVGLEDVDSVTTELGRPGCDDVKVLVAPWREGIER
ncbi:MAG: zinc-binding dehydrogenase [Dehalococcoidia bacterium]